MPFMGDLGMRSTLELVGRQFHRGGLRGDTMQDMKAYPTCQMMKPENRAKVRLLQPLEIPSRE